MKTTDKATARPWHIQNEGSQTIIASQTALESGSGGPAVCYIYNHESKGSKANAALIVQAVNEHAALLAVAEAAHALMMTPGVEKFDVPHYKLAVAIRDLAAVRDGKAVQS